jgi:hypothetical protein
MAEILLNFFDNIILATAVEEVVPAVGFFKDRYFPTGAGDIFKADKVITEYRDGDRKLAAFVAPRVGDIPMTRRGYEITSIQPAYIAPSRLLTLDELTKRGFGEAIYPGMDEQQRAARLLVDDMADMDARITRREEWMAAQTMINNGYGGVHRRCDAGRHQAGALLHRRKERPPVYRGKEVERDWRRLSQRCA